MVNIMRMLRFCIFLVLYIHCISKIWIFCAFVLQYTLVDRVFALFYFTVDCVSELANYRTRVGGKGV